MGKSLLFYSIAICILSGCKAKIVEKIKVIDNEGYIKYRYSDGKILSEQKIDIYNNDSGGYYKEYYSNGVLSKHYMLFNGKQIGCQLEFDKQGKESHIYMMLSKGEIGFEIFIDENGQLIKKHGAPIYLNRQANPIKLKSVVGLYYEVVTSENFTSKLKISILNPSGRVTFDTTITSFKYGGRNSYMQKSLFSTEGNYLQVIKVDLSNNRGVTIKDMVIDTITVTK